MSSPLLDQILTDIKRAMKSGDRDALTVLRSLNAAIKDATVNAGREESDDAVAAVVAKAIKQRKDSEEQFRAGGRDDLAEVEAREIKVLARYQPEQLDEAAIEALVREAIAATGAEGKQDTGKVMKALMPKVKGRAGGKEVNQAVQRLLS